MFIQNKRRGMLTSTVCAVLLHDNARLQTAARTRALLGYFNWELFDHPPYSPDLAPSDYHLFTYLKNLMGSQRFNSSEEFMEGIKTWLRSQAADFFDAGIHKLNPRYDKYVQFLVNNRNPSSLIVLLTARRRLISE
jgi:hypothetical protein